MSETEWEKSRTIFHTRGQNCSLATRSLTLVHYIHKIPNTCLFLKNHLLMLPQLSSRTSRGTGKNVYLSELINPCFLFSFGIKNYMSGDNLTSPGLLFFLPIVLTSKKTLVVIKTIVKSRSLGVLRIK